MLDGSAFANMGLLARVGIMVRLLAGRHEGASQVTPARASRFRLRFDAQPGTMRAVVRATDSKGAVQPERAQWNPSGYFWNGWHSVQWNVA